MPKVGIATLPLDRGYCPKWLFEKMRRLSRVIVLSILEEFGREEFIKRLANPVWFQSLGCVIGFDYNSSGLTTVTLGALKEGLRGLEKETGIFICGGKGKTARKTPQEVQKWEETFFSKEEVKKLTYISRITAKIDSTLLQDGYQLYHHNLIFTSEGDWAVIQQGMQEKNSTARRYHWLSSKTKNFTEEPHSGIISGKRSPTLNLVAKESKKNKEISLGLVREEPKTFFRDIKLISEKQNSLIKTKQKSLPFFVEMKLKNIEFHHHPVEKEKFDLKRLKKIIEKIHFLKPSNFEELLAIEGVGQKTIRALSLVSEVIYGAKPSYEDPARYSFCVGGKDGTPYPIERETYSEMLKILERGLKKTNISLSEKEKRKKRLYEKIG